MSDVLVPATAADLIGQIIDLHIQIAHAPDDSTRAALVTRHKVLARLAARVLPDDPQIRQWAAHLGAARSDIFSLTADLHACDARKDYGTGFIALAQALIAAQRAADHAFAAINTHLQPTAPPRPQTDEAAQP